MADHDVLWGVNASGGTPAKHERVDTHWAPGDVLKDPDGNTLLTSGASGFTACIYHSQVLAANFSAAGQVAWFPNYNWPAGIRYIKVRADAQISVPGPHGMLQSIHGEAYLQIFPTAPNTFQWEVASINQNAYAQSGQYYAVYAPVISTNVVVLGGRQWVGHSGVWMYAGIDAPSRQFQAYLYYASNDGWWYTQSMYSLTMF